MDLVEMVMQCDFLVKRAKKTFDDEHGENVIMDAHTKIQSYIHT